MAVVKYYQFPGLSSVELKKCEKKVVEVLKKLDDFKDKDCKAFIKTQFCYYVATDKEGLSENDDKIISWILNCPFLSHKISKQSFFQSNASTFEIGPRLNFSTAFSTNAVSICHSCSLSHINRIEKSIIYNIQLDPPTNQSKVITHIIAALHDKMTQMLYNEPITSFDLHLTPDEVFEVDVMGQGQKALEKTSKKLGLSFDAWDLNFYTDLFVNQLKRNPTSVECFDLAQSNSEHCRHWYFKGIFNIDGVVQPQSLLDMIINTQKFSNNNNVIKFNDNSSAIEGFEVPHLKPSQAGSSSTFLLTPPTKTHVVFTAETHNFPTGVAPFEGATTGTGGRIRDVQATGRGAKVIAGTVGYCVGSLHIPDYPLDWEDPSLTYPHNLATPLEILIEASNGASDYGNKFGEPVIVGFCRSFGLNNINGERREWVKPIMFTGGIGSICHTHVTKMEPHTDMSVVKVGGPVLRIGVGGGSASSATLTQDDHRDEDLDFNAVQRGDAEMGEKMNRVVRACIEMGENNPICSIHDQGAGGNGNVLKELCHPGGATIHLSSFKLSDPSLSALEVWTAEYQESNAMLVKKKDVEKLMKVSKRERCSVDVVGNITGDNMITFIDDRESHLTKKSKRNNDVIKKHPINLDLDMVLGKVPRKEFKVQRNKKTNRGQKTLPPNLTATEALSKVLRLPSVASKRFLTSKVDRSVSGLVAQQQCVGPLHTPLADVAVVALSHFDVKGAATAIGEQPIKCLVDSSRGARLAVVESITNIMWASITCLKDIKCSGNWMWPAKLPGEDAQLYEACVAMTGLMKELGVAVDGGKDSLSMAAKVPGGLVKSPGNLVISTYAACDDVTLTVTPDLKCSGGKGVLLHLQLSPGFHRIGGSALSQCYQVVDQSECPDLTDHNNLINAFNVIQLLIKQKKIKAGHDVSDGGVVVCVLEMAFAGSCGVSVSLKGEASDLEVLFNEEPGVVVEVEEGVLGEVEAVLKQHHVHYDNIGCSTLDGQVVVKVGGKEVLRGSVGDLRDDWEETSFVLDSLQANSVTASQERCLLKERKKPKYHVSFNPDSPVVNPSVTEVKVAVIREEGSNGDREMSSALFMAGFVVVDVNMQDLISGTVTLDHFRGVVFVGGFSYADVFASAKGWATGIHFNDNIKGQFERFRNRQDTFSLGVCNGCQLMSYLAWINAELPGDHAGMTQDVMLERNVSERYESRFVSVRVEQSNSLMLKGMEGSVLGVWVAHGEGRFTFRNEDVRKRIQKQIALRYTDDQGAPTMDYPHNPNGSDLCVAALTSPCGRHLASMPHPERTVLRWQWPWIGEEQKWTKSPWMKIFHNAYSWCQQH